MLIPEKLPGGLFLKRRVLLRQGMLFGVLAFFFLFCLGLDSEAFARAGQGGSSKSRGSSSSKSSQQNPRSTPPSPQKNYQQPIQQPQPQPPFFPTASNPASGTNKGFFSAFAAGVTGAVLGGMLFRSLGINVPGWGAEFGMVDIFLILFILGIIFYELKRLRAWRATKSAATRAGRSPYSSTYPVRTTGGNRRVPYTDKRRPVRPPRIG